MFLRYDNNNTMHASLQNVIINGYHAGPEGLSSLIGEVVYGVNSLECTTIYFPGRPFNHLAI